MYREITTLKGDDLDSYCNTIDMELHELLAPITSRTHRAEGPRKEGYIDYPYVIEKFDTSQIPSPDQRAAFELMVLLMQWANSLAGTLRYDVTVTHEDCEYHDEHAREQVNRCKASIVGIEMERC